MEQNQEQRIADALERIAGSLEMLAQKPAWVRSAEKVVGTVNTVIEKTPKVEKKVTDWLVSVGADPDSESEIVLSDVIK